MSQNTIRDRSPDEATGDLEARIWKCHIKRMSDEDIAQKLNTTVETVERSLARREAKLESRPVLSARAYVEKLLDEVELVREEAWKAWEDSKEVHVKRTAKTTKGGTAAEKKENTTVKDRRVGNIVFLRLILDCNKREAFLRGIDKEGLALLQAKTEEVFDVEAMLLKIDPGGTKDWKVLKELDPPPAPDRRAG